MNIAIAGIHTGIGKTVCSTILTEALEYDYWKPVQAGSLELLDSIFVKQYLTNTKSQIHPERYKLELAASPHYAAAMENIEIQLDKFKLPFSNNPVIVETAGGLLSPLSNSLSNLDLIKQLRLPTILVSADYLGSINHTLLSAEVLKSHNIKTLGIIFCGQEVKASREIICAKTGLPLLLSIPFFEKLTRETIGDFAKGISHLLKKKLV